MYIHMYTNIYTYICILSWMMLANYAHAHVCVCVCVWGCMCVCVCVRLCV